MKNLIKKHLMLLLIIIVFSPSVFAQMKANTTNAEVSKAENTFNSSSLKLRTDMRFLWAQHMEWTYAAVTSFFTTTRNYDATAARLLKNQEDIGNAIKPYYGEEAGNALTKLLKDHIMSVVEIITAAKRGDQEKLKVAISKSYSNAQTIGDFLANANKYWPKDFVRDMLKTHIDQTLVYATAIQHDDFASGINSYGEAEHHMMMLADALSNGIIAAFPDKFKK